MKFFILAVVIMFCLPTKVAAVSADADGDGLTDELEVQFQTDPENADSDADGYTDQEEILFAYSPTSTNPLAHLSRRLEVDLSKQELRYTVLGVTVKTIPVSTGLKKTPTPTGEFKIIRKIPIARYRGPGYDYDRVKWNLEFKPKYFIHTAYWHNDFGKRPRSHGCVNTALADAEFLYKYIPVGVSVVVVGKTPTQQLVSK